MKWLRDPRKDLPVASCLSQPADVAQMVERLICNQQVAGSIPAVGSGRPATATFRLSAEVAERASDRNACGDEERGRSGSSSPRTDERTGVERTCNWRFRIGEVPKRPKGADCKSAGVCLRRFESSPLHWESLELPRHEERATARGNSSVGRASAFQAERRGFESRFPLLELRRWGAMASRKLAIVERGVAAGVKAGSSRTPSVPQIRARAASSEGGVLPVRRPTRRVSTAEDGVRSTFWCAQVAQLAEHVLGKDEVGGSIPLLGF